MPVSVLSIWLRMFHALVSYLINTFVSRYDRVIENLSQSGSLLHGPQRLPDNTMFEIGFEMPEEISGQKNSTVLCQGRVIRSKDGQNGAESVGLAASILDYKFLRQN